MDAYETRKRDWEDLEVTRDELNNFAECMRKEEFRKLLIEYADEVSSPENRKLYEKEITELEKERGVDVTFVNPEPGYVIKTSLNGDKKCFVNISKSEKVGKPSSQPSYEDGNRGLQWAIPYSLAPPRDDYDKKNLRCTVFDVVFHPDTLYLASKNPNFCKIVNDTALDGVETNYKVELDRKNVKFPKLAFKGLSQPTVIRKPCEKPAEPSMDPESEIYQKLMASYDECRSTASKPMLEEKARRAPPKSTYYRNPKRPAGEDENSVYTVPKFTMKHRSDVDIQDFRNCADAKLNAAIPKCLVIVVDLPLLKSASDASLDVQERSLLLRSDKPARYLLELPLPYCVNGDAGNAKFDSTHKKLTVTLPVVRKNLTLVEVRDSGVESDHGGSPSASLDDGDDECSATNDNEADDSRSERSSRDFQSRVETLSETVHDQLSQDTALRTNSSRHFTFLKPNVKYTLPPFVCNVFDGNLAITINVKNVDSESIDYRVLDRNSGLHIVLSSIGAGFFPVYYSLRLKIHEDAVTSNTVAVEPWDNNIVFTVNLKDSSNVSRYWIGVDEDFMEAKDLTSRMSLTNKFEQLTMEPQNGRDRNVEVLADGENVVINIQSNNLDSDDEGDNRRRLDMASRKKDRKQALSKSRSVSESSGDELPSSNGSSVSKGILKYRRSTFSRSVSESSIDETAGHVSSVDFHYDSIQDINSESDCSSFKKSVRFNDVVSRQLYRSNSSILGQRKKNQRKLRNKKRAHDRRMSESENSETEDREKYRINPKDHHHTENTSHDNVKPILNREKFVDNRKTDENEIDTCQKNGNNNSYPVARDMVNDYDAVVTAKSDEFRDKNFIGAEFKNDLIFDLDI